jgi:hypothetical protein
VLNVTLNSSTTCHQVGGKLIETNDYLLSSPSLLRTQPLANGYVAVLYPETQLPGLGSGDLTLTAAEVSGLNSKVCFAWLKGSCSRGDKCKFEHFRRDGSGSNSTGATGADNGCADASADASAGSGSDDRDNISASGAGVSTKDKDDNNDNDDGDG